MTGWQPLAKRVAFVLIFIWFVWAIGRAADAEAHLLKVTDLGAKTKHEKRRSSQLWNLRHARYVAKYGRGANKVWHRKAAVWIARELAETERALNPPTVNWAAIQMRYGRLLALGSVGDPWPNCPDPHDGSGATWQDTVNCENNGNWLDSPGYYRCGLQFDPMWERHYGRRFCP
jgi:hypothetical protein